MNDTTYDVHAITPIIDYQSYVRGYRFVAKVMIGNDNDCVAECSRMFVHRNEAIEWLEEIGIETKEGE